MRGIRSGWEDLLYGDAGSPSRRDVTRWWQQRRVRYNLLVGVVGLFTWWSVLLAGSAAVKPGVDFEEPLAMIIGPFVYAMMANICYSLGPVLDSWRKVTTPSKHLFRAGLFFSLALTALPGFWAIFAWVSTLITGQKRD